MLQHLGRFKAKRDRQVASSLLPGGIRLVPAVMAHEVIHLLGEFFEVHNQTIIPEKAPQKSEFSLFLVLWVVLDEKKKGLRKFLTAEDQLFPDLQARKDNSFRFWRWGGCRGVIARGHDDNRMIALCDQAVFLACPFFKRAI